MTVKKTVTKRCPVCKFWPLSWWSECRHCHGFSFALNAIIKPERQWWEPYPAYVVNAWRLKQP